jgi:hypothetical protein
MAIADRILHSACDSTDEAVPNNDAVYVRNYIPFVENRFDDWTETTVGDGTVTISADGKSATMESGAGGGRAYLLFAFDVSHIPTSSTIAFGCRVTINSGTVTEDTIRTFLSETAGTDRITTTSDGRWCCIVTLDAAATDNQIRMGLGTEFADEQAGVSITITEPFVYVVSALDEAPHDWVPAGCEGLFPYQNGNTVASGGGLITESTGTSVSVPEGLIGVGISDSQADQQSEYGYRFARMLRGHMLYLESESARTLVDMETTWLAHIQDCKARFGRCDFAVIQGGVNDFASDSTAATVRAALESMIDDAKAEGVNTIFVIEPAPWGGAGSYTAGRGTQTDNYVDGLRDDAESLGILLIRCKAFMAQYDDLDNLALGGNSTGPVEEVIANPTWDFGDGLHFGNNGSSFLGGLLASAHDQVFISKVTSGGSGSGGSVSTDSNTLNEREISYYGSKGYTGTYNERRLQFEADNL